MLTTTIVEITICSCELPPRNPLFMFSMRTATMFLFFALFVTVAIAQEGKILNIGYNSFTHFKGTCLKIFHLGDIIQTADFLSELKLYTKIFLRFIRNTAGLDYQIWVNKYFFSDQMKRTTIWRARGQARVMSVPAEPPTTPAPGPTERKHHAAR